jgi:acyl-homoserine-lactone acylase
MPAVACAGSAPSAHLPPADLTDKSSSREIIWDQYAIPHIYGPDLLSVIQGYGYAQMENHAELILQKIAEARGRVAEYFGPGTQNANVESDIRVRTYGIPERAALWYQEIDSFQSGILQAFASGVNEYLGRFPTSIDQRFRQVLPFTAQDILSLELYTMQFTFLPEVSGLPAEEQAWQQTTTANASTRSTPHPKSLVGSNGWALAPSRTADGNAILMGNPHLPWGVNQPAPGSDVYQLMEANLVVGDAKQPWLNASGVTFPGAPFMVIGFNDHLGWTHTINSIKNADLYELTLVGGVISSMESFASLIKEQTKSEFSSRMDRIQRRPSKF